MVAAELLFLRRRKDQLPAAVAADCECGFFCLGLAARLHRLDAFPAADGFDCVSRHTQFLANTGIREVLAAQSNDAFQYFLFQIFLLSPLYLLIDTLAAFETPHRTTFFCIPACRAAKLFCPRRVTQNTEFGKGDLGLELQR